MNGRLATSSITLLKTFSKTFFYIKSSQLQISSQRLEWNSKSTIYNLPGSSDEPHVCTECQSRAVQSSRSFFTANRSGTRYMVTCRESYPKFDRLTYIFHPKPTASHPLSTLSGKKYIHKAVRLHLDQTPKNTAVKNQNRAATVLPDFYKDTGLAMVSFRPLHMTRNEKGVALGLVILYDVANKTGLELEQSWCDIWEDLKSSPLLR